MEKNHNKEALTILEMKKSQLILDRQAIGSGYIPVHRYKENFLDFFKEYVDNNVRKGKRHLQGSFNHFITFIKKKQLSPKLAQRSSLPRSPVRLHIPQIYPVRHRRPHIRNQCQNVRL